MCESIRRNFYLLLPRHFSVKEITATNHKI